MNFRVIRVPGHGAEANRNASQREPNTLSNDQTEHVARLRTQCDPHTNFVRALSCRITNRSVDTDRRQQQRDRCKQSEQEKGKATLL